jgi:hypothetical protein
LARTIHQLLEAKAAGDPITTDEAERLTQHEQRSAHTLVDMAGATPEDWAQFVEAGDEFDVLRTTILSDLDTKTVPELRGLVLWLLEMFGQSWDRVAQLKGTKRGQRRQRVKAGKGSGPARRKKAEEFLRTIDEIKARPPLITADTDAAKRFLRDTDPDWSASDETDKNRKVDAVTHRIRNARKITGV